MPSISEWRQPYRLSNFDLVTESLTLIAGNSSLPSLGELVEAVHAGRRLLGDALDALGDLGPALRVLVERALQRLEDDLELLVVGRRRDPAPRRPPRTRRPCGRAAWRRRRRRGSCSGPAPSGHVSACSVHHQYSSSVSPFQAKTGTPGSRRVRRRRAAWSWVEKMLHEHQRTSAPSAISVSISTAVWIVMCSEPVMRAPLSGCASRVLLARRHQAGHLVLGELDLLAAVRGERDVGDLVVGRREGRRSASCDLLRCVVGWRRRPRAGAGASPAPSAASRRRATSRDARPRPRATCRSRARRPASTRRRAAKATSDSPMLVLVEQLAQRAQPLQLGRAVEAVAGRASGRARPARRARRSAASAATSRWSPPPRGSSGRPSTASLANPDTSVSRLARRYRASTGRV